MVQDIRQALEDTLAPEIGQLKVRLDALQSRRERNEVLPNVVIPRFSIPFATPWRSLIFACASPASKPNANPSYGIRRNSCQGSICSFQNGDAITKEG